MGGREFNPSSSLETSRLSITRSYDDPCTHVTVIRPISIYGPKHIIFRDNTYDPSFRVGIEVGGDNLGLESMFLGLISSWTRVSFEYRHSWAK